MTTLDALLERGIKCPICGDAGDIGPQEDDLGMGNYLIECLNCGSNSGWKRGIGQAVTNWLVLAGGPVPGSIKPPEEIMICEFRHAGLWYIGEISGPVEAWMLPMACRTGEWITKWLESEQ